MKISRISQALGSISDEFSREAIEEIEKTPNQNDSIIPDGKPRVVSDEKSRKAPIFIALAGLCAAAAIALPLVLKNVGKNSLVTSDNSSGVVASAPKVEKLGYDLDSYENYSDYKFEFTMPEYEGVDFECMHNKITANGEVIASGMPILQVYLADLNGDGRREIVTDSAYGSGILTKVISACDYSEKQLYMFSNRGLGWLDLFENNGELWLRETEYRTKNVLSEKKLELSDMKKIDGFTQEPVRAVFDGDEIPCVDNYESIQEQALESYVFETHNFDEYTVKLVGKQVFKLDKNVTDYVYSKKLCVEVEKDGKLLDSFNQNPGYFNLDGVNDRPKFTVFADKVGSYLDLYELEQPVISMRYYFDENQVVTKAVQFAVIKDGTIYDNFLSTAEAGTGVTLFHDDFATNIEDNMTCFASVFKAEKFRVADSTTLVDDMACIKYTFNFADMLKTGILTTTAKDDGIIELTGENMTLKIDRLKISHNDRELTANIDNVSPNVSFLTVNMNTNGNKCTKFAVVMDEDDNFELFEGDQISKITDNSDTSFLENLPENKFGYMWEYIDGRWQWSHTEHSDKLHNCKHLFDETDGEEVYQVWISNNTDEIRDVCIDFYYNNEVGCTIDIIDNYNGTFSVDSYGSSVSSPCTIIFPKAEVALEAVRKSLIEKTSLSADEAKYYVQNYACYDLDFDGEAEVLVVNTFGSPAVHVFERNGTTYEESSVFPMKALEYTGYKLELNPYQNGDERYYYFRFFSGGGTMEADVLGAIKQTESGYEMEYLYSWGTLDYKGIPEPVKKEFYRKGWDKYDLALADSNPNDIPKEELAGILKKYGITLN